MGLQIAAAIFLPFIAYGLWAALRGRNRGGTPISWQTWGWWSR